MVQRSSGSTVWWAQTPCDPPTPDERWLLEAVEEQFATEATDLPEWADPHDDPSAPRHRREPHKEEYSRCLDPEKYRIVLARAAAYVGEKPSRVLLRGKKRD